MRVTITLYVSSWLAPSLSQHQRMTIKQNKNSFGSFCIKGAKAVSRVPFSWTRVFLATTRCAYLHAGNASLASVHVINMGPDPLSNPKCTTHSPQIHFKLKSKSKHHLLHHAAPGETRGRIMQSAPFVPDLTGNRSSKP
ncbi:hypothetical protein VNO77_22157 [Canavalia gladiata]|uniref:Uncharacterized protein n=1 Tax=Canavalia gladiata TaxID=3824 RepID=A0AAN9L3H5_CANGL